MTLWSSDGDSIHYQMDRGYHGGPDFIWDNLQGHEFGWTINPTITELAPVIWNYYMTSASGVSFIAGLAGAGFTHPARMSDPELQAYVVRVATYMRDSGFRWCGCPRTGAGSTTGWVGRTTLN